MDKCALAQAYIYTHATLLSHCGPARADKKDALISVNFVMPIRMYTATSQHVNIPHFSVVQLFEHVNGVAFNAPASQLWSNVLHGPKPQ